MREQLPLEKTASGLPSMACLGSPFDNNDDDVAKPSSAKFVPLAVNNRTLFRHGWIDVRP